MPKYFELQEGTSSKFWEINLSSNVLTTRYGKIGTAGKSTEKVFDDATKAQKEFDKLVKEKVSKGYRELAPSYTLISEAAARERFQLDQYIQGSYGDDYQHLLYEGDVVFTDDLLDLSVLCAIEGQNIAGIIVHGNMTVKGVLYQPDMDYGQSLLVTGDLTVKSINKGGGEFYIKGNVTASQTIYGYYNHGQLTIDGNTDATVIFSEDHFMKFGGEVQGIVINTGAVEGVTADYTDTSALHEDLVGNDHYTKQSEINAFINEGKHILQTPPVVEGKNKMVQPKLITFEEADVTMDISFENVLCFEGDLEINGDLDEKWVVGVLKENSFPEETADLLMLVKGSLTVHGDITPGADSYPCLMVVGNVTCEVIKSYDEIIHITGDADVKYAIDGNYNHGSITIEGATRVPYVLNSDHSTTLNPVNAVLINYYSDYEDFFDYDYTVQDFERVMVSSVYKDEDFDQHAFIKLLKQGKSPLKKGSVPGRLIVQKELEKLSKKGEVVEELDLSDKRLTQFPKSLLSLTSLKRLILNDNAIGSLPEDIGLLVNLEELHLQKCSLESLPEEIGNLTNLKVLNVSRNGELVLPESIANLKALRVLDISYNQGYGLQVPLPQLEELTCYQCTGDAPEAFPEAILQCTGLKKLLMGSNSILSIPESFLQLKDLEELRLDASLCYLDSLPDLSKLTKLRILRANGLISFLSRPYAKQSLLKSFFSITSLEELHIDRHGKQEENFIKGDTFEKITRNLAHDPARLAAFTSRLTIEPNAYWGDGRKGITRDPLDAAHLEGISALTNLRFLDLGFNDLTSLPEEMMQMKQLSFISLYYNKLPVSERLKIRNALPGCTIDFRNNFGEDSSSGEEVKLWGEMSAAIRKANELMSATSDPDKLRQSLVAYDEVLAYFSSGRVVDDYNQLYAHYGKAYAYSYLNSTHKHTFSPEELKASKLESIRQGLETLELVPAMIWHFTELGAFHREVLRVTANSVAWQLYELGQLEEALRVVERGVESIEQEGHFFVYDTKVRILLQMGRKEEAWEIVRKVLKEMPSFGDFKDLKGDEGYKKWVKGK